MDGDEDADDDENEQRRPYRVSRIPDVGRADFSE
jgi:hypothetical protein